jgi:predicted amidophosphoribosyltransferase
MGHRPMGHRWDIWEMGHQKRLCATCKQPTTNIPALCDTCLAERRAHRIAKARARKRRDP